MSTELEMSVQLVCSGFMTFTYQNNYHSETLSTVFFPPKRPNRFWSPPTLFKGNFLRGLSGKVLNLTSHLHLVPGWRINSSVSPLTHAPLWRVMGPYKMADKARSTKLATDISESNTNVRNAETKCFLMQNISVSELRASSAWRHIDIAAATILEIKT